MPAVLRPRRWLSASSAVVSTSESFTSPGASLMSAWAAWGSSMLGSGFLTVAALVPAMEPKMTHSARLPPELYWKAQMPPSSPAL